jgi:hypothetical protein
VFLVLLRKFEGKGGGLCTYTAFSFYVVTDTSSYDKNLAKQRSLLALVSRINQRTSSGSLHTIITRPQRPFLSCNRLKPTIHYFNQDDPTTASGSKNIFSKCIVFTTLYTSSSWCRWFHSRTVFPRKLNHFWLHLSCRT